MGKLTGRSKRQVQTVEGKLQAAFEAASWQAKTLQVEGSNDTMGATRYSMEGLESGKSKEESKGDFIRAAVSNGYEVVEGEQVSYGYRPVQGESAGENARQVQSEVKNLGIDADIIEDSILWNRNGTTSERSVSQAVTVDGRHILINNNTSLPPRNVAGHEAFHLWKNGAGRDAYIEAVEDNLIFTNPDFVKYQSTIAEAYLGGEADLSDETQLKKLREELFAYISGDIHEGANDEFMRPMFRDFDAVKTAWNELVEKNKDVDLSRHSLKGTDNAQELAALKRENESLKERVAYWKSQTRRTQQVTTDKMSVAKAADALVKDYGANIKGSEIAGELQNLYTFNPRICRWLHFRSTPPSAPEAGQKSPSGSAPAEGQAPSTTPPAAGRQDPARQRSNHISDCPLPCWNCRGRPTRKLP